MDFMYIFALDIFCIILAIIGTKYPLSAFIAFLISMVCLIDLVANNGIEDMTLLGFTVIAIISSALCAIVGWRD